LGKGKAAGAILLALLCVGGLWFLFDTYLGSGNWILRFDSRLDRFFGQENWEYLSAESKDSIIYTEYRSSRNGLPYADEVPGKFKNWTIAFSNRYGEAEVWTITNHTLKINHDRYWLFSPNRYSNSQALVQELMEIACACAGDQVLRDVILQTLTPEEASCLSVDISYQGGNPEPAFYDALWEEPWFTANGVTAKDFLTSSLCDFYLDIRAYDYRLERLTTEEQQNVLNSFEAIRDTLLDLYGEYASFRIYLDGDHRAEYFRGVEQ
jgi:hypothetical protein